MGSTRSKARDQDPEDFEGVVDPSDVTKIKMNLLPLKEAQNDDPKKKECVPSKPENSVNLPLIPQESTRGETPGRGNARESHYDDLSQPYVPPETKRDPQKQVKEFPSVEHGDMTFTGTNRTWAKYVRASCDTEPKVLFELMTEQWKLRVPNLLISVTGGAKTFNISPRLKTQFSRGLVKVAQSTGAWIITGGSHAGVMKLVGEAIRDFSGGDKDSEIALIGIATWGIVHNRTSLIKKAGESPALYPMDEGSQGELWCLDNNHTHFILVDDGTHGEYWKEIKLRTRLEQYISEEAIKRESKDATRKQGTDNKIPIVCVALEGGPGTLDTIYNSMLNNTPCVIVEGSGRVADIIAQVANLSPPMITINLIREKLQNLFSASDYDNFTEDIIIEWTMKIQVIVCMGSLLNILREEKVGDQEMDVAILQALLKASHSEEHNGQENWNRQLKLAMSWNRPDIAETQIFTEEWTWKPSDLYKCLTLSLIEDKPTFVRLFLERGVSLSEYLTCDRLTDLYKNTDPSSLIHSKLKSHIGLEKLENIELHHVSCVLQKLLGDLTEPLCDDNEQKKKKETEKQDKDENKGKKMDHPLRDLLIWCIVQNRAKLADVIWNVTRESVAGALACTKILRALSKKEKNSETVEKMRKLANTYEERAVGVFSECYHSNEKRAELLLIHVTSKWGRATALELAQKSQALTFMSQGGVQIFLTKTWWGNLSVDNGFLKVFLCVLCFPLIYTGLISYRKVDETPSEQRNQSDNQDPQKTSSGPRPYTCFWKLKAFFTAPIVKFYYNVVSYIGFLWHFAYVLMIDFQTYPSWTEYLLYVWVFSILIEELRQLFYDPKDCDFKKKSDQYIKEFWNLMDLLALGLFAVGLICRWVRTDTVYLGRVWLSLGFMIFCIRLMHMFYVSKVLGPKIIMIHRMLKDLFFFFFLLAIWILSYGVAKQAILTTNEDRLYWIFRNVVYEPYLTLFGHFPSDVDSLNFDPTKCSQDGTDPDLPKCVFNDGSKALFPEWLTIILMCLYLLLANILLLNLLIAMFSHTFGEVENQTDQLWKFHRFGLLEEYIERPVLPPPFILFSHIYIFLKYVVCRRPAHGHKVLRLELKEEDKSSLLSWESHMKDKHQQNQPQQDAHSQENLVKNTAESVSAVLRLEGRMSQLEKQCTQYHNWMISALKKKGFSSDTDISMLVPGSAQDSEEKAAVGTDGNGEKKVVCVNARILQYPDLEKPRYPVPDEFVPWEVEFPGYNPQPYNAERNGRGAYDPETEMAQKSRTYNSMDGIYDFRSCWGTYTDQDGLPRNPMGRTGLSGVGSLRWFGPNHSLHLVLTRRSPNSPNKPNQKSSKKILEVLVVKRMKGLWSLPGGTLDPGQKVPSNIQALLKRTHLIEFLALLDAGTEVFHGYLDDPRNTDNAWIETSAINIHLDTQESSDKLLQNLKESDHHWKLLDHNIPMYSNEKEILQKTAEHLQAHY